MKFETVLQFSGGKDSLACLMLNRHRWDEIAVLWCNSGAAYPSVVDYMAEWAKRLPHFIEVQGNQPDTIKGFGWPSDVVPVKYSFDGALIGMNPPFIVQSYLSCCARSLWAPMVAKVKELGAKTVIRGQRAEDARRAPFKSGYVAEGITYLLPIEDWSTADVLAYLEEIGEPLPPYYAQGERSSRDCMDCTGYLDDNMERVAALPDDVRGEVRRRLLLIKLAAQQEMPG